MVQRIVAPYAAPAESAESQRAATERIKTLNLLLTHILHDEGFQALEAAWRGLDMLVHGLDTDSLIHLHILDMSKERLRAELNATADIRDSSIYRALPGRWGLIAANISFDREVVADVESLERVSALAQALGAPLIAEWLTSSEESTKAEAAWQALRRTSAAQYVALALPRFLLRLPYGKETVPVDGFEFEETKGEPAHREYLWGNPAFACALALGRLYEQQNSLAPIPAYLRLERFTDAHCRSRRHHASATLHRGAAVRQRLSGATRRRCIASCRGKGHGQRSVSAHPFHRARRRRIGGLGIASLYLLKKSAASFKDWRASGRFDTSNCQPCGTTGHRFS